MRDFARSFYLSQAWIQTRKAYVKSVGGLCEDCLARGIVRAGEIVHHITPLTPENINDTSITLDPANLRLVCRDCHAQLHGGRRWKVAADGSIAPRSS